MWISPDCHGVVAVLVISGMQPLSGLLHTLRIICVCVWPLSAVCYSIASSSSHRGSTLVFPGIRSHVSPHRLTSTTQPLCHCARVYHNIQHKELFRKVMQFITAEKCKANRFFREKFLVLANHGRWLAKSLAKGSASDRPR